mgnify:CR=1 FL=1|jgi:hypothetical protein
MRGGTVRARNEAAVSMNPLVDTAVCVRLVRSRKDTSSSPEGNEDVDDEVWVVFCRASHPDETAAVESINCRFETERGASEGRWFVFVLEFFSQSGVADGEKLRLARVPRQMVFAKRRPSFFFFALARASAGVNLLTFPAKLDALAFFSAALKLFPNPPIPCGV